MKRKPITRREMEAAYRLCLERERIRERDWRETKQGAFESAILRLDLEKEESLERERSTSWLSDRGKGAKAIRRAADPRPDPVMTQKRFVNRARMAIVRHMPECLMTFRLVLKNETNWKESVWELMKLMTSKARANGQRQKPSTLHSSKKC